MPSFPGKYTALLDISRFFRYTVPCNIVGKKANKKEMNREVWSKKASPFFIGAYIILVCAVAIFYALQKNAYSAILCFASLLFLGVPYLFYRLFRVKPLAQLNLLIYGFVLVAYTFGVTMRGYNNIAWLDKVIHTSSGVLFTFVGFLLFYILKAEKRVERHEAGQGALFSVSFSMTIAVLWEFLEYALDFILHNDPQRVATTGIHDTMQDLLVCALGSLIMFVSIFVYYRTGKKGFLTGIVDCYVQREQAMLLAENEETI